MLTNLTPNFRLGVYIALGVAGTLGLGFSGYLLYNRLKGKKANLIARPRSKRLDNRLDKLHQQVVTLIEAADESKKALEVIGKDIKSMRRSAIEIDKVADQIHEDAAGDGHLQRADAEQALAEAKEA